MAWFASSRLVWVALASVAVTGCAGGSLGDSLQKSLEADPQLQTQFPAGEGAAPEESDPEASTPTTGEPEASDSPSNPTSDSTPGATSAETGEPKDAARPADAASGPQPEDIAFIGPVPPAEWGAQGEAETTGTATAPTPITNTNDLLAEVPADLKPYVQDWLTLGLTDGESFAEIPFQPSRTITRGEYAQWLFAANNQFFSDQPAKRIRPGSPNSAPAFQDVPPSHPYYSAIQGLAEAGLIPSALTGNATDVTFRPDATLTRENLLLWKVPLDTRAVLPVATVEAVQAAWGFQDAAEIEPLALRAVLADRQTGDFANILRAFGFTTLLQPKRAVSQSEAAAVLWRFGHQTEGVAVPDLIRRGAASAN